MAVIGVSFAAAWLPSVPSAPVLPPAATGADAAPAGAVVGGTSASKIGVNEAAVCGGPSSRISESGLRQVGAGHPFLSRETTTPQPGVDTRFGRACHTLRLRRLRHLRR